MAQCFRIVRVEVLLFVEGLHHVIDLAYFVFPALHTEGVRSVTEKRMLEVLCLVEKPFSEETESSLHEGVIYVLLLASGKSSVNRHFIKMKILVGVKRVLDYSIKVTYPSPKNRSASTQHILA